jgi:hypothetical protein
MGVSVTYVTYLENGAREARRELVLRYLEAVK